MCDFRLTLIDYHYLNPFRIDVLGRQFCSLALNLCGQATFGSARWLSIGPLLFTIQDVCETY